MPPRRLDLGYVGPDDGTTAATVDALRDRDFHVAVGHSIQDSEGFAEERAVDCLVVDHRGSIDAIAVLEAVAAIDEILPVVVYPTEGSEDLAAGCVALDVEGYVPRDGGVEALAGVLGDVRPAGDPRRDAEGMLDALLNLVPRTLSIYFKDTAGRHVAVSREFPGLIGPPYFETPDGLILHDAEDVLGRTDFALYRPHSRRRPSRTRLESCTPASRSSTKSSTRGRPTAARCSPRPRRRPGTTPRVGSAGSSA